MIDFLCDGCSRPFNVPDHFAGRKARCKTCGRVLQVPFASEELTVAPTHVVTPIADIAVGAMTVVPPSTSLAQGKPPLPATSPTASTATARKSVITTSQELPAEPVPAPPPAAATPRPSLRSRRLLADARQMSVAFRDFPLIRVFPMPGDPPEAYQIEYAIKGLEPGNGKDPTPRAVHRAEIQLTGEYPRMAPRCRMLTPIFHPNIDPTTICVGDHWTAGERLVDLVVRIGEMIAYQAYNIKSPLDAHAAMWADLHPHKLPVDPRPLRPVEPAL